MDSDTTTRDSCHAKPETSSSMLAPFIYDTSSLQDRLIQGAGYASTYTTTTTHNGESNRTQKGNIAKDGKSSPKKAKK